MVIGTQLFGLGKELEQDLWETLCAVKGIGFELIEGLIRQSDTQNGEPMNVFSMDTLKEARECAEKLGLSFCSVHVCRNPEDTAETIVPWLKKAHEIGGLTGFVFSGMLHDEKEAEDFAALMNSILQETDRTGLSDEITLLYHNHAMEFTPLQDGSFPLDVFLAKADPRIKLELDFGWADYAGRKLSELKKYFDRVRIVHLKDFNLGSRDMEGLEADANKFASIGEGTAPIRETLELTKELTDWDGSVIIDQDYCPTDMLESLAIGYRNVKSMTE